jgi:hypothetical protein
VAEVIFDLAVAELKRLDGLGVAHRDDPAAFDFLHSLLREPLVGRLRELPGAGCLCWSRSFSLLATLPFLALRDGLHALELA